VVPWIYGRYALWFCFSGTSLGRSEFERSVDILQGIAIDSENETNISSEARLALSQIEFALSVKMVMTDLL
jgi:hypothetical protein